MNISVVVFVSLGVNVFLQYVFHAAFEVIHCGLDVCGAQHLSLALGPRLGRTLPSVRSALLLRIVAAYAVFGGSGRVLPAERF